MRKMVIALIALMVVSVGFLSGCNQQTATQSEKDEEIKDTDGDGYPDDEDDYPTDSGLYEREKKYSNLDRELEQNQGFGFDAYVESDVKFIEIFWNVRTPSHLTKEQQENIEIGLLMQPYFNPDAISYEEEVQYSYDDVNNRNIRIAINKTNWGDWHFGIINKTFVDIGQGVTITIQYVIYYIK